MGDIGGLAEVRLSIDQMPSHDHAMSANALFRQNSGRYTGGGADSNLGNEANGTLHRTGFAGAGVGRATNNSNVSNEERFGASDPDGAAHENRPPFFTLVWIIRTKGVNTLLDGTQILGGDVEFQAVGENLVYPTSGNGADTDFALVDDLISETDRAFTVFKGTVDSNRRESATVSKLDLTDSGVGIFPERVRSCTLRFRSRGQNKARAGVYYKYPDGNFRKCVMTESANGTNSTAFQENFINIPIDSSQTELEFVMFSGNNHYVELFITAVEQVVDNSLTRLKKSYGSRKNLLLNGNFDFWERQVATGATFDTTTSDLYSADRWKRTSISDTDMTLEVQQGDFSVSTNPPEKLESGNFPKHYIKLKGHSDDLKTSQFAALEQRIEDYRTLNHKNATLTFWAKGNAIGNFHVGLIRRNDQGGEQFVNIKDFRIEEIGNWKKYTTSIIVPEVTFGYTNLEDTYLSLIFHTAVKGGERGYVGTSDINYTGTLSIAQVQLEEGSNATPFEHLSVAEELPLLQRYYWRDDDLSLSYETFPDSSGREGIANPCYFPVTMRTKPATTSVRLGLTSLAASAEILTTGKRSATWQSTGGNDVNNAVGWDADAEL